MIARYISSRLADDELVAWTVALVSVGKSEQTFTVADSEVGLTKRSPMTKKEQNGERAFSIRRILSPTDEFIGLDPQVLRRLTLEEQALRAANDDRSTDRPSGARVRRERDARHGLLILYPLENPESAGALGGEERLPVFGFAASFPGSKKARAIEYTVNEVMFNEMFDQEFVIV